MEDHDKLTYEFSKNWAYFGAIAYIIIFALILLPFIT